MSVFLAGRKTSFTYNGKTRIGIVEAVKPQYMTVDLGEQAQPRYKNFRYDKITAVVRLS